MSDLIHLSEAQTQTLADLTRGRGGVVLDPVTNAGISGPITASVGGVLYVLPVAGDAIPEHMAAFDEELVR